MDKLAKTLLTAFALAATGAAAQDDFNVLRHVGGNGQWFPGPDVTGISSNVPEECTVDLFASFSRHGSRYPTTGAFAEWMDLYSHIQSAGNLTVSDPTLEFLQNWKPVLDYPERQIAQISTTGYKELYDMGVAYRFRYPQLYEYNTPLAVWANWYESSPRVRDSARLFARGFLGPNATELGTVYALNGSDPSSFMNSLATSDLCPAYADEGGSPYKDTWESIYLPPIRSRLNAQIQGGFNFTQQEVSIIPYLCGFETQITGSRSPFCDIFTEDEILQYEYAQDLRYWYGNSLGTDIEKSMMLPVLDGLVQRFIDGPNATYQTSSSTTFTPPNLMVSFSNDGQINQLIAGAGVFDGEPDLPANRTVPDRKFRASRLVPMRGTIAFERLSCSSTSSYGSSSNSTEDTFMRVLLNDVVYPVVDCESGPGRSCPLRQYERIIKDKLAQAGNFADICNVTDPAIPEGQSSATFFEDNTLPFITVLKP